MQRFIDFARRDGVNSGLTAPGATITVYDAGTVDVSSIYNTNSTGDAKSNPFTADNTTALYHFYAADGRYDIRISGAGITVPYTLSDVRLLDTSTDAVGFRPEDYGAVGDCDITTGTGTDDTVAMQACVTAAAAADSHVTLNPGSFYKVTDTIWAGAPDGSTSECKGFVGWGSGIYGAVDNKPVIDAAGGHGPDRYYRGFRVIGDETTQPSCGILFARGPANLSSGLAYCQDLFFDGYYQTSAAYIFSSETNSWENCYFINRAGIAAVILTDTNSRGLTSPNITLGGSTSTIQNFLNCTFSYLKATSVTDSTCVEVESFQGVRFRGCQTNATPADIPHITIYDDPDGGGADPNDISIVDHSWHGAKAICVQLRTRGAAGICKNFRLVRSRNGLTSTNADVVVDANFTVKHCDAEVGKGFNASAANVDLSDDCRIRSVDDSVATVIQLSDTFHGEIHCLSTDTLTLSGAASVRKGWIYYSDLGTRVPVGDNTLTLDIDTAIPDVSKGEVYVTANTGAAPPITSFTGGKHGQQITILIKDANTTFDFTASDLKGHGGVDWVATIGSTLKATYSGAGDVWYCVTEEH
jgi:hypothetical protein